ncbi:MAG: hypothetical protein IT379_15185 [Deltaproteobacteria bacterium]|nr:hypothetical protein [Deltaproteobacteria bacterium]
MRNASLLKRLTSILIAASLIAVPACASRSDTDAFGGTAHEYGVTAETRALYEDAAARVLQAQENGETPDPEDFRLAQAVMFATEALPEHHFLAAQAADEARALGLELTEEQAAAEAAAVAAHEEILDSIIAVHQENDAYLDSLQGAEEQQRGGRPGTTPPRPGPGSGPTMPGMPALPGPRDGWVQLPSGLWVPQGARPVPIYRRAFQGGRPVLIWVGTAIFLPVGLTIVTIHLNNTLKPQPVQTPGGQTIIVPPGYGVGQTGNGTTVLIPPGQTVIQPGGAPAPPIQNLPPPPAGGGATPLPPPPTTPPATTPPTTTTPPPTTPPSSPTPPPSSPTPPPPPPPTPPPG